VSHRGRAADILAVRAFGAGNATDAAAERSRLARHSFASCAVAGALFVQRKPIGFLFVGGGVIRPRIAVEHDFELRVVLPFERRELAREVRVGCGEGAQPHARAHDLDVYRNGTRAPEHARQHGNTLLGESVGRITAPAAPGV
jgi:hypothetical protein